MKKEEEEKLQALAEAAPENRESAYAQALEASRSADRELRAAAAEVLAEVATPDEAVTSLGALARDADVGVRYAAIAAFAGLPWRMRFGFLRSALDDADLGIVAVAADGLSYAGDKRAAPALRDLLAQQRTRFGAMEGLYALRDPDLIPFARQLFGQFFTPMFDKSLAALTLAREGDAKALEFLVQRTRKKFSEERNFVVAHLAAVSAGEGRAQVEQIAGTPADASCETALLALTRLDAAWWPQTEAAVVRNVDTDAYAAGETLLGLFDIDWRRAAPIAAQYVERSDYLGIAARKVRLGAWLRSTYQGEVQLRCD